ncbi:TIR domain-containing protein [Mesorhizobium amorphae]|uniref:TIR domain-containing protein n=1 Tax=Mesorhizobium amorphae TaxID=71433 RepID=UPI001111FDED|nr:hypothetical protein GCM10007880_04340 [Mesorhizobium amorphae]
MREQWWARAVELITASDRVVFIASSVSVKSKICADELTEADRQKKAILPILVGNIEWHQIPAYVSRIHGLRLTSGDAGAASAALLQLSKAVVTNLSWVRTNTRYFEEAKRWEAGGRKSAELLRGHRLSNARKWIAAPPPRGELVHVRLLWRRSQASCCLLRSPP